jgi:putative membrane protein
LKRLSLIAGLLGLALLIALVAWNGHGEILKLLDTAGWALLWLIPFHALPLLLDAEGWRVLLRPRDPAHHATLPWLFWIATIREAVSRLLPLASVGGELVGIRLALMRPLPGPAVAASVIVEVLLTVVNQYLFTALGLVLLLAATQDTTLLDSLALGLAVSLPVPIGLYYLLRHGSLFAKIERALISMLGEESRIAALLGDATVLDIEIRALSARNWVLAKALLWQFAGMVVGAFETWLALHLLGHDISPQAAVAIESLTLALRHFAFFVPGGLGVQEAGYVLFGRLVGLPADVSIALSFARRAREIGFGVSALLSWQWIESRRILQTAKSSKRKP